jgi:hypothetical protein
MEMNPQAHTVLNTRQEPGMDEKALQERSCDPAPDLSLPADEVLTDRMSDLQGSTTATLFVP